MHELIEMLKNKSEKTSYALCRRMAKESAESDLYYVLLEDFARLVTEKSAYVRTRGFLLACAQAPWDRDGGFGRMLPEILVLLHDEKPTVVRQCLDALTQVVPLNPAWRMQIEEELEKIDLSKYKDSMAPLIRKDMARLQDLIQAANEGETHV